MAKDKNIDFSIWITQQAFADLLSDQSGTHISIQRVHNWVRRNKIESKEVKSLGLTLVNKNSLSIKTM